MTMTHATIGEGMAFVVASFPITAKIDLFLLGHEEFI
jgi:hypothetical protein